MSALESQPFNLCKAFGFRDPPYALSFFLDPPFSLFPSPCQQMATIHGCCPYHLTLFRALYIIKQWGITLFPFFSTDLIGFSPLALLEVEMGFPPLYNNFVLLLVSHGKVIMLGLGGEEGLILDATHSWDIGGESSSTIRKVW